MTPDWQRVAREVHPELSFHELLGGPLPQGKKTPEGRRLRQELLVDAGFEEISASYESREWPRSAVAIDDILDAHIACWTARRIARGESIRVPAKPGRDSRGLLMEIWR